MDARTIPALAREWHTVAACPRPTPSGETTAISSSCVKRGSTSKLMGVIGCLVFVGDGRILVHADYPTWRIVARSCVYVGFVARPSLGDRAQTREQGRVEHAFIKMNVMAQLFVVGMAGLTGGVHSPFLPGTLIPAIVSLLFFGPQSVSRWIALGNGLFIDRDGVAAAEMSSGPRCRARDYAIAIMLQPRAGTCSCSTSWSASSARSRARPARSSTALREERLGDAEAQLRRLQSVGAKVAHELKNPLAVDQGPVSARQPHAGERAHAGATRGRRVGDQPDGDDPRRVPVVLAAARRSQAAEARRHRAVARRARGARGSRRSSRRLARARRRRAPRSKAIRGGSRKR